MFNSWKIELQFSVKEETDEGDRVEWTEKLTMNEYESMGTKNEREGK